MHSTLTKFQDQYQKPAPIKKYTVRTFAKSYNWLERRREISGHAKRVYARLIQYVGNNEFAFPSREALAKELGISVRSLNRYLRELLSYNLISIERVGKRKTNKYYILPHVWMKMGGEKIIHDPTMESTKNLPEAVDNCQKIYECDGPSVAHLYKMEKIQLKKINKKNNSTPPVGNFGPSKVGRPRKHPIPPAPPPHLVAEFPEVWKGHFRHNRPEFAVQEFVKAREKVPLATIKGALDDYYQTLDWRDRHKWCKGLGKWLSEQNWETRKVIDMTEYTKPLRTNFPTGHFSEIPREDREKIANGLKGLVIALQTSETPKQPLKAYSQNLNLIKPVGGVYGKIRIDSTSEQQNAA